MFVLFTGDYTHIELSTRPAVIISKDIGGKSSASQNSTDTAEQC